MKPTGGGVFGLLVCAALVALAGTGIRAHADDGPRISGTAFSDRELLVTTALQDEEESVRKAEQEQYAAREAFDAAEVELAEAQASGDAEAIAEATRVRDQATDRLQSAETRFAQAQIDRDEESQRVRDAADRLTDEQVFALNRSLNNARHNRFGADVDAEHLEAVADGNYDGRQINALTKALEEEAKFEARSERFEERYEATGAERFQDKAERFESRGEEQKRKFMSKIDRFGQEPGGSMEGGAETAPDLVSGDGAPESNVPDANAESSGGGAGAVMLQDRAREMTRTSAERTVLREVRQESRESAKASARESARQMARESAREAARDERRDARREGPKVKEK